MAGKKKRANTNRKQKYKDHPTITEANKKRKAAKRERWLEKRREKYA